MPPEGTPVIEWVHDLLAAHVFALDEVAGLASCLGCREPHGRLWAVSGPADLRYEQGGHQAEVLASLGLIQGHDQ